MANILAEVSNIVIKSFGGVTRQEFSKAMAPSNTNSKPSIPKGILEGVDSTVAKTQGQPTDVNYDTLYRIYKQESWVRACVDIIKKGCLANSWQITANPRSDKPDDKVKDQLLDFFEYPNPSDTMDAILTDIVGDLQIYGNAYIELVRDGQGYVRELYNLDATTIKVKHDEHGVVLGYVQEGDSSKKAEFEPEEVVHFKLASKGATVYGLSPLESLIRPVDTDLKAQIYIAKYYENFGAPKALFKFKNATPDQVRRNRLYLATEVTGVENAHKNLILEGDVEYTPLGTNMRDTETLKIRAFLRDEMLAVYGVPPSKVSIIETGNLGGNSGSSQDKTFKLETIMPLQKSIMSKLTHTLIRGEFEILDWFIAFGAILEEDRLNEAKIHAVYLKNKVLTPNEVREDLGKEPLEGGDVVTQEQQTDEEDTEGLDQEEKDKPDKKDWDVEEEDDKIIEDLDIPVKKELKYNFKKTHSVNTKLPKQDLLVITKKLDVNFNEFDKESEDIAKIIKKQTSTYIEQVAKKLKNL